MWRRVVVLCGSILEELFFSAVLGGSSSLAVSAALFYCVDGVSALLVPPLVAAAMPVFGSGIGLGSFMPFMSEAAGAVYTCLSPNEKFCEKAKMTAVLGAGVGCLAGTISCYARRNFPFARTLVGTHFFGWN